ncbi:HAD-IA family hydrolase [Chroogloeocystis siderophila]|uniref:Carotenoid oxygenase n=1 Tax=Chroogloeocystis siderophila 5.2 s.c.1 TaxID=247279 RepID=A0A1U7HV39_9CHRO|nr:HAD-IA family hydrolase [Chroogloeocystis siderophila]OKH27398.1 carotenoid oxygenase [Chroogloeocystis siderophila 5.2 s.c.1]
MTAKVIIFDFDGTLANTIDVIVDITNRLALEFGYKQTTQGELDKLKNLSSREIVKQSGISILKLPFLIKKVRAELNKEIKNIKPISEIKDVLYELSSRGHQLGIVTSNSKENIGEFLEKNEWQHLFDFVYSGTTLFGKSKIINNLIKQRKINREQIIYVGDETRDIEAARKSNVKAIAVTWGFNSAEVLAEQNPDFLVSQPQELLSAVMALHTTEEMINSYSLSNEVLLN